jgi:hypothetical protein
MLRNAHADAWQTLLSGPVVSFSGQILGVSVSANEAAALPLVSDRGAIKCKRMISIAVLSDNKNGRSRHFLVCGL